MCLFVFLRSNGLNSSPKANFHSALPRWTATRSNISRTFFRSVMWSIFFTFSCRYVIKELIHAFAMHLLSFIIQHIDTQPKYGHKTLDVRSSTWRISRKKKRRKEKRKITDHLIGQKRREICALCRSVSRRSWMKAQKAGSKFQPLD